jgi:hypothetical protein
MVQVQWVFHLCPAESSAALHEFRRTKLEIQGTMFKMFIPRDAENGGYSTNKADPQE